MLSGYLKGENADIRTCWKGLMSVLWCYLLSSLISIPVRHFLLDEKVSVIGRIRRIFRFNAVYYGWYVNMYIGLTLMSPFINRMMKSLSDKMLLLFAVILVAITGLPGALP